MKLLLLAFLFATILASATLILPHQQVSAQQPGPALVIKKVVEGSPPPSNWEFDLNLDITPYSSVITIDKAGGEATLIFAVTGVQVTIVERTKSNYVVYVSDTGVTTQTNAISFGTGRLTNQVGTVTIAFINQYTFTPSAEPVGGFLDPVNKLAVFAPSLALFAVMMVIVIFAARTRKKPEN